MEAKQSENRKVTSCHIPEPICTAIAGDIALPMGKPEMASVWMVYPRVHIEHVQPQEKQVQIEGTLTLQICYLCTEGRPHSFESTAQFRQSIPVENPNTRIRVMPMVTNVEVGDMSAHSVHVTSEIALYIEEEITRELQMLLPDETGEEICTQIVEVPLAHVCAYTTSTSDVNGEIPLLTGVSPAETVLCCNGYAEIKRTVLDGDSLGIEGELKCNILYATQEESAPIAQLYGNIPFTRVIPVEGLDGEVVPIASIEKIYAQLDEFKEKILISAVVTVDLSVYDRKMQCMICDAYSTGKPVTAKAQELALEERAYAHSFSAALRERMEGNGSMPSRILGCYVHAAPLRAYCQNGILMMEGELGCDCAYIAQDGTLHTMHGTIPVRLEESAQEMDASLCYTAFTQIEQAQGIPAGAEVEIRGLLSVTVVGTRQAQYSYVNALEEGQEGEETPFCGILVYFARPGDTVWDVAKRYRVDMEELLKQNEHIHEPLTAQDRLILVARPR